MDRFRTNTRPGRNDAQQDDWDAVHQQLIQVQETQRIQKKSLSVSQPGDADEQEADEIARKVSAGESMTVHQNGGAVNRKGEGPAEITPEFQSKLESSKGNGETLPGNVQQEIGNKMGTDFGDVKVHTDSEAHSMNESLNAKAFTNGNDIYFRNGEYNPGSTQGKELLTHELVHTVQQNSESTVRRSSGHDPGQDYTTGTITASADIFIKQTGSSGGKNVYDPTKKYPLYFKNGDAVTRVGASANNMWVEVKGTAHYKAGTVITDVPDSRGWLLRRNTSMTLGMFEGLPIANETSTSGPGAITTGSAIGTVNSIVLHQTDGSSYDKQLDAWKKGGGVGAQYLIGEDGQMALVVPINERVGHVRSNRDVVVKEPTVADPAKVTDAEMKTTRDTIDGFYNTLSTVNIISKDLHDYYAAMDSQTLYNTLKANKWQLNAPTGNTMSIGIEVVHRHSYATYDVRRFADDYSSKQMPAVKQRINDLVTANKITEAKKNEVLRNAERDEITKSTDKNKYPNEASKTSALEKIDKEVYAALKKDRWKINGHVIYQERIGPEFGDLSKKEKQAFIDDLKKKNLSPELKAQLLKTEQRDKLEKELTDTNTSSTRKIQIEADLDAMNKELFNFMAAYDFMIYEDISGAQKYSMWLLVGKLTEHYNLDPMTQVVGHEDVDYKVVGEGQNEAEFIRTMTEFTRNVNLLKEIISKAPSKESKDAFQKKWQYEIDIINSIEKGETNNATVLDFFNNFYTKTSAFNTSGALNWIKLYRKVLEMNQQ